jgi:toxin ParE1/3/4
MKRIRVSHHARRDLDSIWHYIANDASNADIADRVIDSIVAHFAFLARQPEAGRSREDIGSQVRSFPSGDYLIYYRDSKPRLVISRILHGKRDQQGAWNKPEAS